MLTKIKLWWKFEARYYHYDILNGLKNIIKWLPIIWKDRDWDYTSIYEVLKFKLKKQANYIKISNRFESSAENAEIIMKCVELIDKIQTEFYTDEYLDYHDSDFEFIDVNDEDKKKDWYKKGMKTINIIEISEHFDDYFNKYPDTYQFVINNKNNKFPINTKKYIAINMGCVNHENAKTELFKLISENIEKWWN